MMPSEHPIPDKTKEDYEVAQLFLEECANYGFPLPDLLTGDSEAHHHAEMLLEFVRLVTHGHNPPKGEWPTPRFTPGKFH